MSHQEIKLDGGKPWGFTLMGGLDHHSILRVGKVTPGSKAQAGDLQSGDVFISINGQECTNLKHVEAQLLVKNSGEELRLIVERGAVTKGLSKQALSSKPIQFSSTGRPKPPAPPSQPTTKPSPPPTQAVTKETTAVTKETTPPAKEKVHQKPAPPAKKESATIVSRNQGGSNWYKQLMKTVHTQDDHTEVVIPQVASKPQQSTPARPSKIPTRSKSPPSSEPSPKPTTPHSPKPTTPHSPKPTPLGPKPKLPAKPASPKASQAKVTPPKATPSPPEPQAVVQTKAAAESSRISTSPPAEKRSSRNSTPINSQVEEEYKEYLEKKRQEEEKLDELERQIAADLLDLESAWKKPDSAQPAPKETTVTQGEAQLQSSHRPRLYSEKREPQKGTAVVISQTATVEVETPNQQPFHEEPNGQLHLPPEENDKTQELAEQQLAEETLEGENPSEAVDTIEKEHLEQHLHPLIEAEINKEAARETSPGKIEGDFSALEQITAPGRHLPGDAGVQTHRQVQPDPVAAPTKTHKPPPCERAKALYDFSSDNQRDLPLVKGDIITLTRTIDDNWLEGELKGRTGILPVQYIEFLPDRADAEEAIPPPPAFSNDPPCCKARYVFVAEKPRELGFEVGDTILLNRVIDDNWLEGTLNGKTGIFPFEFVDILVPLPGMTLSPSQEQVDTGSEDSQPDNMAKAINISDLKNALQGLEGERCEGAYDYNPKKADEIEILVGDSILVYEKCEDGWFLGVNERTNKFGTFPGNYVVQLL